MKFVFVRLIKIIHLLKTCTPHCILMQNTENKINCSVFFDLCPKELSFVKTIKEKSQNKYDQTDYRIYNKMLDRDWFSARLFVT